MARSQIAGDVSEETKQLVERFTEARGLKKGFVLEQALLHYVQAMNELPADLIVPARIVVTPESLAAVQARLAHPQPPTAAMVALRSGDYASVDVGNL